MKKIAYLSGTRADFGLMKNVLKILQKDNSYKLLLFVTGMHLLEEFGHTINEVKKDFKIMETIQSTYEKDNRLSMALFTSDCLKKISLAFNKYQPDSVLVLGDRGEQLASALAAVYLNIPVIHLHGGEISGTIDNKVRNAISDLATYHLPATKKAAESLFKKGFNKKEVFVVGAPGLDELKTLINLPKKQQIIVLQHPAEDENQASKQIEITLKTVCSFKIPTIIIYPNADAGGRRMIEIIRKFSGKFPFIKTFPSLPRFEFLKLLASSSVLVGNSSLGIIEAPSLHLAVVNIGERQKGREKSKNIIDVDYNIKKIKEAIKKSLFDTGFKQQLKRVKNPYGEGQTAQKILALIKKFV